MILNSTFDILPYMILQVGVKALLKNKEGKYLILKRTKDAEYWDIPGGRIEPGSGLLQNLQREIKEETGLETAENFELIAAQDIIIKKKDTHIVRITYKGTIDGNPVLSDEHEEYAWMTIEEMKRENVDIYVKEILEKGRLE